LFHLVCKMLLNSEHGAAIVVDFTREKPVDVEGVAAMCNVNPVTVRRWFKRGLDWCKLGGKVITTLEALNRFQSGGDSQPMVQAVIVDHETLAALKSLRQRGIIFGSEAHKDGRSKKTAAAG